MDHLCLDGLSIHPGSLSIAPYDLRRRSSWLNSSDSRPTRITRFDPRLERESKTLLHVGTVFLAAWLVMPGIPALIGIAPSPPLTPSMGYGAEAGPFDRTTLRYAYPLPEEVVAIQGPTEEEIEFSIYLTLPHLPEEPGIEGVPLAILFHAFNNPSIDSYTDWIDHLSAKEWLLLTFSILRMSVLKEERISNQPSSMGLLIGPIMFQECSPSNRHSIV